MSSIIALWTDMTWLDLGTSHGWLSSRLLFVSLADILGRGEYLKFSVRAVAHPPTVHGPSRKWLGFRSLYENTGHRETPELVRSWVPHAAGYPANY